jgi:hypothetical protein
MAADMARAWLGASPGPCRAPAVRYRTGLAFRPPGICCIQIVIRQLL